MDLAQQQCRIERQAEVVDHRVTQDLDGPGRRIDFQFADVATVREGRGIGRVVVFAASSPGSKSSGRLVVSRAALASAEQIDCAIGAADLEHAVVKGDVGDSGLHEMRRERLAFMR